MPVFPGFLYFQSHKLSLMPGCPTIEIIIAVALSRMRSALVSLLQIPSNTRKIPSFLNACWFS